MFGIKLHVWGNYACFTRPEMKVERVSYDVITPSAARGIIEAIYWKPSLRWIIDKIHVLNPIEFTNIRRNELEDKISVSNIKKAMEEGDASLDVFIEDKRQQRAAMILKNVSYVIEAHFEIIDEEDNNPTKHKEMFDRRARKGQCFHRPYLGCREFPANFDLLENSIPQSELQGKTDLGWMLLDLDFENNMEARFFRAQMADGVIEVPLLEEGGR